MTEEVPKFVESFNETVREAEAFRSIVRAKEFQLQACDSVETLLTETAEEKSKAIAARDEDYANLLLGCECAASALLAEIRMWVKLKDGEPDKAWDLLVEAQFGYSNAMRAHRGFEHLGQHCDRLEAIEKLVFPPQVFTSSGLVIRRYQCSICGEDYEQCEHLAGLAYMGVFCSMVVMDLEMDHLAFVETPADKRCRATGIRVEGGTRNRMTLRVEPDEGREAGDTIRPGKAEVSGGEGSHEG